MYLWNSNPNLSYVTIVNNTAYQWQFWGSGAGMYLDGSNPTLTHVIINENSADNGPGGGIFLEYSHPTLSHVTISGNLAPAIILAVSWIAAREGSAGMVPGDRVAKPLLFAVIV